MNPPSGKTKWPSVLFCILFFLFDQDEKRRLRRFNVARRNLWLAIFRYGIISALAFGCGNVSQGFLPVSWQHGERAAGNSGKPAGNAVFPFGCLRRDAAVSPGGKREAGISVAFLRAGTRAIR
jgi:hypothetical protein